MTEATLISKKKTHTTKLNKAENLCLNHLLLFNCSSNLMEIWVHYNSIPGYCTIFFTCYNNTAAITCDHQFKNINWTCNVQHGLMCYFNLLQVSFNRMDIDFLLCGIGKVEDGLLGPWFSAKNITDAILPEKKIPLWRFPSQRASYVESVSISWHHHVLRLFPCMGLLPDT